MTDKTKQQLREELMQNPDDEIKLNHIIQKLPQARRDKIRARTAELIAEQMTLRDTRKV